MKKTLLLLALALLSINTFGQMVMEYEISTSNTEIKLPLAGTVNVTINWGDGSPVDTVTTAIDKTHSYTSIGNKTVTITGTLSQFGSSAVSHGSTLTKVLSWDGLGLNSLQYAFKGAFALTSVPNTLPSSVTDLSYMFYDANAFNQPIGTWNTANVTDMSYMFSSTLFFNQPIGAWNTANVTNMSWMFSSAPSFNQPIGSWNTQNVTAMTAMFASAVSFNQPIGTWNTTKVRNMDSMFGGADSFNQPIGTWNTANVTDMSRMFLGADSFNQPIGTWNTAQVTKMAGMFNGATSFNQPIDTWNTANVTDMSYLFCFAIAFNQPIGNWNTQNVTDMRSMFNDATLFNQPISNWNTANVTDIGSMFYNATSFNQPISTWNITKVINTTTMFYNAKSFDQPLGNWKIANVVFMGAMFLGDTLCTENYDNLLIGWAAQTVKTGVSFDGGGSKYSAAASAARATLISKGWIIRDGGEGISGNCKVTEVEGQTTIDAPAAVYPNPATNELYSTSFAQLYDVTGKLVVEGEGKMDVSPLPRGMYILKSENKTTKIVLR